MSAKKDGMYTKKITVGDNTFTLYSLDGITWSSRKEELKVIEERREAQRVTADQLRGDAPSGAPTPRLAFTNGRSKSDPKAEYPKPEHPAALLLKAEAAKKKADVAEEKKRLAKKAAEAKSALKKAAKGKVVAPAGKKPVKAKPAAKGKRPSATKSKKKK